MPTKETRKILKVGGSHAVTLPKKWKDYHEFKDDMEGDGKSVGMLVDRAIIIWMEGDEKAEKKAMKFMEEED